MAAPFNWHWTQWIMEWWRGLPTLYASGGGPPPLHVKTISLVLRVRKCHPDRIPRLDRGFFFLHPPPLSFALHETFYRLFLSSSFRSSRQSSLKMIEGGTIVPNNRFIPFPLDTLSEKTNPNFSSKL